MYGVIVLQIIYLSIFNTFSNDNNNTVYTIAVMEY